MVSEIDYLYAALEKTGFAVMVRQFDSPKKVRRSKLLYLSDNIETLGMNVKNIVKGYRLPEDYIHPEDRDSFAEAMKLGFRSGNDFSDEVRVIGDDNKLRKVNMDIIFLKKDPGEYVVEYIISEVRNASQLVTGENVQQDAVQKDVRLTKDFVAENRVNDFFDGFANACELYSALIDMNGRLLAEPKGPASYFGEFYEYLENPLNKPFFEKIKASLVSDSNPVFLQIEDESRAEAAQERRIAAAPIVINGICCGMWLLYAHNKSQAQKLFKVYNNQWNVADAISEHLSRLYNRIVGSDKNKAKRDALEFEIKEKKIITKMMTDIGNGEAEYSKYFEKAGKLLGVDYVVFYAFDDTNPEVMNIVDYWSKRGKSEEEESNFAWEHDHYDSEMQGLISKEGMVIDRNNMTNRMRVEVFEGKVRAIMVYPVKRGHKYFGRLIFIENTRERIWSESEKDFAKEMARAVAKLYASGEFEDSPALDNTMLEVFDSMEQDIFIRDNITGKVLYSNKHMNDRLGMDFVDKDSFRMIPKPQDEIPVAEASDKKGRSTKFRRYINELGSIFDVTEISITWKNGEPASVMILTPAVD